MDTTIFFVNLITEPGSVGMWQQQGDSCWVSGGIGYQRGKQHLLVPESGIGDAGDAWSSLATGKEGTDDSRAGLYEV